MIAGGVAVLLYSLVVGTANTQTDNFRNSCNATDIKLFKCEGGGCIPLKNTCDSILDCPTGNDESTQQCGCLPNEFLCANSCIDIVKRCDRKLDCPGGEDEDDCKNFLCPVTHFKCSNDYCVPLDVVCNFVNDCGDDSDETKCLHRSCWKPEFRCENGECIRPGYVCDGTPHCKDSSDESDCLSNQFVDCGDGTRKHRFYWCDGWPDCPNNHADEINCSNCTGEEDFLCPNGRCISRANLCDSQCDCLPTSPNNTVCVDELNCDQYYTIHNGIVECGEDSLICREKAERCLRGSYICDGVIHCHSFPSDEFGCEMDPFGATPGSVLPGPITGGGSFFRCMDGRSLPSSVVCDYRVDCLHGDDEHFNCSDVKMKCKMGEWQCKNGQCIPAEGRCDIIFDCLDKSDEKDCKDFECPGGNRKCGVGGQCLEEASWCDFLIDCPDQTDEESCPMFRDCLDSEFRCSNGQCVSNSVRCFRSGLPRSGCADSSHLVNCSEWECSQEWFKCPGGPCINRSLICNSKIDCPDTWEDEDNCPFACSISAIECECRDVHINCTGRGIHRVPTDVEKEITWFHLGSNQLNNTLTNETFQYMDRMLYLDLSNNSISKLVPRMFRWLWRLQVLNLQHNLLNMIDTNVFVGLPSLRALHLKGNRVIVIHPMAFYGLSSLPNLDLKNQEIVRIMPNAFVGLRNLKYLDISANKLTMIEDSTLIGMPHLLYLDISNNRIKIVDNNAFKMARLLETLLTDEFRLCCLAREVKVCLPPADEFSSCEDLMSNLVLRVCVWVLASVAILGNILVIACRASYKHTNQKVPALSLETMQSRHKVHSFLITNLALGDLLMGSYLLLIALVDLHYRGVYSLHDSSWRSSTLCSLAGFISTFSSELSVFTLTVITLDRFLVIIFPFRVRRLEMARTRRLMAFGWILAACLSAVPLLHFDYFKNFYGRSGVCLALHITPDKPSGWEYSVFVFLFLNLVSFTIIAVGYLWMFLVARTTQHAVVKDRRASEAAMAWRMTLLVATDAACWVPIILLGLVSLAGQTVPRQVFAWVAVFVLPLNAAVNPVLYTLSTAPFLTPARHRLHTFRRSCKMSLSVDNRRTISSNIHSHNFTHSRCTDIELCTPPKTAVRWRKNGNDAKLCSGETLLPLKEVT